MSSVLVSAEAGLARITLNRPQALHALDTAMCETMIDALIAWRDDECVHAVLLDHAQGTRGFCAGGDVRMIAESGAKDGEAARFFFFTEYRLNHLLFHYPKPIVALIDGVTMGGGVGISMPARFRIATAHTTYAMPETGIGLFPDVGGGWYLPRKPGQIGMWLALTGARLKAPDCLIAGVATHFAPANALPTVLASIAACASSGHAERALEDALAPFRAPEGPPVALTPANLERINRLFALDTVEAIVGGLEADGSDWAITQLETLRTKSPQALKVTFRQMREGARVESFTEEMRREYRIAARACAQHDFQEGVRALFVDKDNKPAWAPASLSEVGDDLVDQIFAPLPAGDEWTPL